MDNFVDIVKNLGFPIALLFIVGIAIWRIIIWLGKTVITPVTNRHIKFLDDVTKEFEKQTEELEKLTGQSGTTLTKLEEVVDHIETVANAISEVKTLVVRTENVTIAPEKKQ